MNASYRSPKDNAIQAAQAARAERRRDRLLQGNDGDASEREVGGGGSAQGPRQ